MLWNSYSFTGLTFGVLAAITFAALLFYAWHRPRLAGSLKFRLGNARAWRSVHLWAGLAFMLLVLLHTGLRWPNDTLTMLLFLVSAIVTLAGALGWGLQAWLPRKLANSTKTEILFERIPELHQYLQTQSTAIAENASTRLAQFYKDELAEEMRMVYFNLGHMLNISPPIAPAKFEHARQLLRTEEHEALENLQKIYLSKRELDIHFTVQTLLRLWIWLHAPAAFVLLALIVLHIFSVWVF